MPIRFLPPKKDRLSETGPRVKWEPPEDPRRAAEELKLLESVPADGLESALLAARWWANRVLKGIPPLNNADKSLPSINHSPQLPISTVPLPAVDDYLHFRRWLAAGKPKEFTREWWALRALRLTDEIQLRREKVLEGEHEHLTDLIVAAIQFGALSQESTANEHPLVVKGEKAEALWSENGRKTKNRCRACNLTECECRWKELANQCNAALEAANPNRSQAWRAQKIAKELNLKLVPERDFTPRSVIRVTGPEGRREYSKYYGKVASSA